MSLIFCKILGPLVVGWAPIILFLRAQLAPGEKKLVCIPVFYLMSIDTNMTSPNSHLLLVQQMLYAFSKALAVF